MLDFLMNVAIPTLDSTIRMSTPLLLVCLAGLYSERAGVVDIGLEGKLLGAAFGAAAAGPAAASGAAVASTKRTARSTRRLAQLADFVILRKF